MRINSKDKTRLKHLSALTQKVFHTTSASLVDIDIQHRLYSQIQRDNYIGELNGQKPDFRRSICKISDLILNLSQEYKEIIVFDIDSISFQYYLDDIHSNFDEHALVSVCPISSVFPTTSASAWTSIITGATPSQHGVYGASFLLEEYDANYLYFRDKIYCGEYSYPVNFDNKPFRVNLYSGQPIFTRMAQQQFTCYFNNTYGGLPSKYGKIQLRNELLRDVICLKPPHNEPDFDENPDQMLDHFLQSTSELLHKDNAPKLIWNYINLDTFVHLHGYNALSNIFSWRKLADYWHDNAGSSRVFLLISDHGQVPQQDIQFDMMEESMKNTDLAYNSGGAGRVMFFYPRPGKYQQVVSWLSEKVQDTGLIISRAQLSDYGFIDKNLIAPNRIGEVISVGGYHPSFPSATPSNKFEHGAITVSEMYVPLLIGIG